VKKILIGLVAISALSIGWAVADSAFGPDVGPKADVAAVRAAVVRRSQKPLGVHVSGDYALLEFSDGENDGVSAYKRVSGERWKPIADSNLLSVSILVDDGVPRAVARRLCSGWPTAYALCMK
jgi:hypothetical protein